MKRRLKNMVYLLSYAWGKGRLIFFTTAGTATFHALLPLIDIAGLGLVVEALTNGKSKQDVVRLILLYLALNLVIAVLKQLLTLADNNIKRKVSDITQLDYMRDCIYINYHYAQDGSILDLKKKSMGTHPVWFLNNLGVLLQYLVQFAGVAYLFAVFSPLFLFLLLLTSAFSLYLSFREQRLDFEYRNDSAEDERMMAYLYETMSDDRYAKEVRINRAGGLLETKYSERYASFMRRRKHLANQTLGIHTVSTVITIIQTAAMYLYFSYQVSISEISIGEYTVLLGATTLLTSLLVGFFHHTASRGTLDYTELFRQYRNHAAQNSGIFASCALSMPEIDRQSLRISFENVSFTYPGAEHPILEAVSFTIEPGEKIGIVGLNGSGKTTLIKLLCRLYDPTDGRITLNGIDIRNIPHNEYTKLIGIVLQDFCLFAYSVKENVVFDSPADEERFGASIQKSGLSDKIASLRDGVHTSVYKTFDDSGVEFSGGEGQKLALARAIYKEAGILILDEPTSALDPLAEHKLFSSLSEIADGKTTLFISHRLSSTKFCDRILVLADGKIAETGSHGELMRKNGIYADLFSAQARYYEAPEAIK